MKDDNKNIGDIEKYILIIWSKCIMSLNENLDNELELTSWNIVVR